MNLRTIVTCSLPFPGPQLGQEAGVMVTGTISPVLSSQALASPFGELIIFFSICENRIKTGAVEKVP